MNPQKVTSQKADALRHDHDFRLFWLARMSSLTGSAVTLVALPVLVYRLTGAPLLTSLVAALEGCFTRYGAMPGST